MSGRWSEIGRPLTAHSHATVAKRFLSGFSRTVLSIRAPEYTVVLVMLANGVIVPL